MRYSEADVTAFQQTVADESPTDAGNAIWNVRHAYDAGCKFASWSRSRQGHLNTFRSERGLPLKRLNGGESGFLSVQDGQLVNNGQPWILGGYTHFDAPSKTHRGADLDALLDEPIRYGANAVVWFAMRANYDPHKEPGARENLRRCLDTAGRREIRVLLRLLVDRARLGWSDQECADFVGQTFEDVSGRWNVIASLGNELPNEGAPDPGIFSLPDLHGVLASRGTMGGEALPDRRFWQIAEYEPTRRFPAAIFDCGTGMVQMRMGNVAIPNWGSVPPSVALLSTEPIGFDEATSGSRSSDPNDARALGSAAAFAANMGAASGIVFHTTAGQTCDPLGPRTAECAYALYNGLYAGFVR